MVKMPPAGTLSAARSCSTWRAAATSQSSATSCPSPSTSRSRRRSCCPSQRRCCASSGVRGRPRTLGARDAGGGAAGWGAPVTAQAQALCIQLGTGQDAKRGKRRRVRPPHPPIASPHARARRDFGSRGDRQQTRLMWLLESMGPAKFVETIAQYMGPGTVLAPAVKHEHHDSPWPRRDLMGVHPQKQPGLNFVGCVVPAGRLQVRWARGGGGGGGSAGTGRSVVALGAACDGFPRPPRTCCWRSVLAPHCTRASAKLVAACCMHAHEWRMPTAAGLPGLAQPCMHTVGPIWSCCSCPSRPNPDPAVPPRPAPPRFAGGGL